MVKDFGLLIFQGNITNALVRNRNALKSTASNSGFDGICLEAEATI